MAEPETPEPDTSEPEEKVTCIRHCHEIQGAANNWGTDDAMVHFRHPGYPDAYDQNVLLSFPAFDGPNGTTGHLHYGTAMLALGIISGNRWDGFLTVERDGRRIKLEKDDLLPHGRYFYYLPEFDNRTCLRQPNQDVEAMPYPICPSLDHWNNPVVEDWPDSVQKMLCKTPLIENKTLWQIDTNAACLLSGYRDYVEPTQIIPVEEYRWVQREYGRTQNFGFTTPKQEMRQTHNIIHLRKDICQAFNENKFVFVPKHGKCVAHFLEETFALGRAFHNVPVVLDTGLQYDGFIVARFAWAIFKGLQRFLCAGIPRRLVMRKITSDGRMFFGVEVVDWSKYQEQQSAGRNALAPDVALPANLPVDGGFRFGAGTNGEESPLSSRSTTPEAPSESEFSGSETSRGFASSVSPSIDGDGGSRMDGEDYDYEDDGHGENQSPSTADTELPRSSFGGRRPQTAVFSGETSTAPSNASDRSSMWSLFHDSPRHAISQQAMDQTVEMESDGELTPIPSPFNSPPRFGELGPNSRDVTPTPAPVVKRTRFDKIPVIIKEERDEDGGSAPKRPRRTPRSLIPGEPW